MKEGKYLGVFVLSLLIFSSLAFAQDFVLNGRLVDEDGNQITNVVLMDESRFMDLSNEDPDDFVLENRCDINVSVGSEGNFSIVCDDLQSPGGYMYRIQNGSEIIYDDLLGIFKLSENVSVLTNYSFDSNGLWNANNRKDYYNASNINVGDIVLYDKYFEEDIPIERDEREDFSFTGKYAGMEKYVGNRSLDSLVKYASWQCSNGDVMVWGLPPENLLSEYEDTTKLNWLLEEYYSCEPIKQYISLAKNYCNNKRCEGNTSCEILDMEFGNDCQEAKTQITNTIDNVSSGSGTLDENEKDVILQQYSSNNDFNSKNCSMVVPCFLDDKCYPLGYRKDGMYCDDFDLEFVPQKKSGEACDNSFECSSSLCVDSVCIDSSLIQKVLKWFRNLFG